MKTRTGFVSNSSSSSFVMLVPKEVHERILKEVHPYVSTVARAVMKPVSAWGQDFVVFHELSVQDYSGIWENLDIEYDGDDDGIGPYEAFHERYSAKLKDDEILTLHEDD